MGSKQNNMAGEHEKRTRKPSRRLLESKEEVRSRSPVIGQHVTAKTGQGRGRGRIHEAEIIVTAVGTGRGKGNSFQVKPTYGRGRGRGKGQQSAVRVEIQEIREERRKKIEEAVTTLSGVDVTQLLVLAVERDPALLIHLEGQKPPTAVKHRPVSCPKWCVCGHCREMTNVIENKCCRKTPTNCISQSRDMEIVVLDPMVLYVYRMYRRDVFALHGLDEGDLSRQNRHAAYRSFVLWTHGRLISGDRRVIPSCCVCRIRDTYPDPNGHYTGFVPGRLG